MPQNENGQNVPEKVHSKMLRAGTKNYFFDVKKTVKGTNYLTIAESYTDKNGKKIINRIMIFKDHFPEFKNGVMEIESYL